MNEYINLYTNDLNYGLNSWQSEKIKHNIINWVFNVYSNSTYKIKVEYFLNEDDIIDTEEKIISSGYGFVKIFNKSRYIRFNVIDLVAPCILKTQGFYYDDDLSANNVNSGSSTSISNLPFNSFEEIKCGIPHTYSAFKWTMSVLNPSPVTFASGSLKVGYKVISFQSDSLPDAYGQCLERGTIDIRTPNKSGTSTFTRIFGGSVLYQSGTPMSIRWTTIFDVGNYVDNKRDESFIGFGNITNSTTKTPRNLFAVGYSGSDGNTTSEFGIFYYRNGVRNFISQSNFNIDKLDSTGQSGKTLDPTKGVIWEVDMAYLGFSQVLFKCFIGDTFIKCHKIDFSNVSTETQVSDPSFGFFMQLNNTLPLANSPPTGSPCMGNASFGIVLWSAYNSTNYNGYDRNISYVAPNEVQVITIRNPPTFNGRINSVLGSPLLVSSACDGNRLCVFKIYATTSSKIVGASWTQLSDYSPIEVDTAGTYTPDPKERVISYVLGKSDTTQIDMTKYNILAGADSVWVITVKSLANSDVYCAFSWSEIH